MLSNFVIVYNGANEQHRLVTVSSLPCYHHLLRHPERERIEMHRQLGQDMVR